MALQHSGALGHRTATAGQITGAAANAATYAMWLRLDTDLNDYSTFWSTQGADYLALITGSTGTGLRLDVTYDSGANTWSADPAGFTTLTVGDWLYVCIVQDGTTLHLYTAAEGASTLTSHGTSMVSTSPGLEDGTGLGTFLNFGIGATGSLAHYREWTDNLTQAELEDELTSATAVRTANLNREYRFASGALATDSSGNGNTNTVAGTAGGSFTADPSFTVTLTVADAASASTADNVALTQVHVLAADDASSASTADGVALAQAHTVAADDATSASTVDAVVLVQAHALVAADATSASTVDNVTLAVVGPDAGVLEDVVNVAVVDTTIEANVL